MFNLITKRVTAAKPPQWAVEGSETVKALYQAIVDRVAEIEALILKNEPLTRSQYKINKSSLCKDLGYSDSYINKHEDLNAFVESKQKRLNRSVESLTSASRTKKYAQNKLFQMCREKLIDEVRDLRKHISHRQSEIYVSQLNHLIDCGLTEIQTTCAQRIKHLEAALEEYREKNCQLETNNKRLANELIQQLELNSELKIRANENKSNISRVK